ncbi:MAG: arginine--tRNA ligase [Actinomycetota bacterium]|nr:arginine--tRNA ligase [Actinomycetota bacterium]
MSREKLSKIVDEAINKAAQEGKLPPFKPPRISLERPKRKEHGDWATNIAIKLASQLKMNPHAVAEIIASFVDAPEDVLSSVEVAGQGFINFHLAPEFLREILFEIDERKEKFGSSGLGKGERVQIEFVSANPVGPLHIGHGRWAAFGDSLARVMEHAGYNVEREFYINDYGTQMRNFGESISARYLQLLKQKVEWPEGGYRGNYITEIAKRIISEHGESFKSLSDQERTNHFIEMEYPLMLESIKKTLDRVGVHFNAWTSERELYRSGEVNETLSFLEEKEDAYRNEGALWLRTSRYGDEKDRVLIRSNGEPTYFASDIAYHRNKMNRGFDRIIDIWGADHHGYVARMKAAMKAMGYDPEKLEVILGQLVKLYRGGEPVTMSKRTGDLITLDELLDEVGTDAARYFFLQRSNDSPLDFDIEFAKKESPENPVYYVQYAHARISSILRHAEEKGTDTERPSRREVELLNSEPEMDLMRKLAELEELVEFCAEKRAPHRLTTYAEELASSFHVFYRDCRVVTEDAPLTRARLFLVECTREVLRIVLRLLGVSAPERM